MCWRARLAPSGGIGTWCQKGEVCSWLTNLNNGDGSIGRRILIAGWPNAVRVSALARNCRRFPRPERRRPDEPLTASLVGR